MLVSNAHGQCSVAMLPSNGTYVRTNVLTKSVVTWARYLGFRNAHARIRIRLVPTTAPDAQARREQLRKAIEQEASR